MLYLAWRNITRRLGSSILTAFIAFVAIFMLCTSLIVVASLETGVKLSRERLGADVMVLPAGASGNTSEVLFCAEPVNVYLPASAVEAASQVSGVDACTPQFFTQTVDESCCSVVGITRIVGIDPGTDFILRPWIVGGEVGARAGADAAGEGGAAGEGAAGAEAGAAPAAGAEADAGAAAGADAGDAGAAPAAGADAAAQEMALGEDGILLGAAAPAIEGGQASILGSVFHSKGVLAPTGTSVDETIFMDIDTARTIAANSPYLAGLWEHADPNDSVSCIMVKVAEGTDAAEVASALMEAIPGSVAVRTSDMVSSVSSQLVVGEAIALVFLAMLVLLAALALAGRFAALSASRMGELGLLRTLGVSRLKVVGSFALEIGLVTLAAAVAAVLCAYVVSGAAVDVLHTSFDMPGAAIPEAVYVLAALVGVVFAVLLALVALGQPIVKMLRQDPEETLARGEM